jgi:ATPase subunit of ABC transporter with duplicated ATPase domains
VDQSRDSLRDDRTVWEEISDGMDQITIGKALHPVARLRSAFNFRGSDQQKRVGILSGGRAQPRALARRC